MTEARQAAEVEKSKAAPGAARPYVELAKQLEAEVARIAADPDASVEAFAELFDALPRAARIESARSTFQSLPTQRQWEIVAELFDDAELRLVLRHEHERALDTARRAEARADVVDRLAADHVVDTRLLPDGEQVTLGLFREADVRQALTRGRASSTCARRLVVRTTAAPGVLHVIEDVFNPAGGLFVTPDYDERAWREDRLEAHSLVRLGARRSTGDGLDPVLHPGGRVDVEVDSTVRTGRLHLGFVLVGDSDLLASHPPHQSHRSTVGRQGAAGTI